MTGPAEPEPFEDINEAVGEEWVAETTPYERVREVVSRTYAPTKAETIADRARTSPKTARKHLSALADNGFVATETGANGATLFHRSAESLVVEQAADILSEVSTEELLNRIAEMRDLIGQFQREYGVESPEELAVDQTNELLDDSARTGRESDNETIREWKTTRRNLAFANAALSIANAEKFVDVGSQADNETASSS